MLGVMSPSSAGQPPGVAPLSVIAPLPDSCRHMSNGTCKSSNRGLTWPQTSGLFLRSVHNNHHKQLSETCQDLDPPDISNKHKQRSCHTKLMVVEAHVGIQGKREPGHAVVLATLRRSTSCWTTRWCAGAGWRAC